MSHPPLSKHGLSQPNDLITASGGAATNHVLFNFPTSGTDIQFSIPLGGGGGPTAVGIYLSTVRKINLTPGTILGEVIGGNDISISSIGLVKNVPEPSTYALVLAALGVLGMAAHRGRRGK